MMSNTALKIFKLAFQSFIFLLLGVIIVLVVQVQYQIPIRHLRSGWDNTTQRSDLPEHISAYIQSQRQASLSSIRADQIAKVEAFFAAYGAPMAGYGSILVDQAAACGGDYRVLVGIAGSESGLGRIPVLSYNPFGYLDGVQYASWTDALTSLSCKVSRQHIAPCGTDLQCLVRRYAGPSDDAQHFVDKVMWFFQQVD